MSTIFCTDHISINDYALKDERFYGYGLVTNAVANYTVNATTPVPVFKKIIINKSLDDNKELSLIIETAIHYSVWNTGSEIDFAIPEPNCIIVIPSEFSDFESYYNGWIPRLSDYNDRSMIYGEYVSFYNSGFLERFYFGTTPQEVIDAEQTDGLARLHSQYLCTCNKPKTDISGGFYNTKYPQLVDGMNHFWIWLKDNNYFSSIKDLIISFYIFYLDMCIQSSTKTYTNSTWNVSKTWYIKTTFSKGTAWNVVNYVTMAQKPSKYNST